MQVHYERTVRERMARPGRRTQQVCTGTLVQCEQKVRERPGLMGGGWVGYRTSVIAARTLEDTIAISKEFAKPAQSTPGD